MYEIKKIDILSFSKLFAAVIVAIYLVVTICFSIFYASIDSYNMRHFFTADFDRFSILWIAAMTVVFAIIGFGAGAAGAAVYNLVAKSTGGIKMDIILRDEEKVK